MPLPVDVIHLITLSFHSDNHAVSIDHLVYVPLYHYHPLKYVFYSS